MSDVPPIAALPAVTGVATVMLGLAAIMFTPLSTVGATEWAGIAALGALLTAPVFLISHELILRKGPLFTSSVALVVPFLVRLGEWALGDTNAPGPISIVLLAVCSAGVWMTVSTTHSGLTPKANPAESASEKDQSRKPQPEEVPHERTTSDGRPDLSEDVTALGIRERATGRY
jgi:hypothetical protein